MVGPGGAVSVGRGTPLGLCLGKVTLVGLGGGRSVGQEAMSVELGYVVSVGWVSVVPKVCRAGDQTCGVSTLCVHGVGVHGVGVHGARPVVPTQGLGVTATAAPLSPRPPKRRVRPHPFLRQPMRTLPARGRPFPAVITHPHVEGEDSVLSASQPPRSPIGLVLSPLPSSRTTLRLPHQSVAQRQLGGRGPEAHPEGKPGVGAAAAVLVSLGRHWRG